MLGSGEQCSGQKEQHMQSLGETELRAFFTHARVLSLRSELLFILTHGRASIHFDYYYYYRYYVKEKNFASEGG